MWERVRETGIDNSTYRINIAAAINKFDSFTGAFILSIRWLHTIKSRLYDEVPVVELVYFQSSDIRCITLGGGLASKWQFHRVGRWIFVIIYGFINIKRIRMRQFRERWVRATWRYQQTTGDYIAAHLSRWWCALRSFVRTLVRARQRDERNRRRPVVPRIGRRVHKSSGIPRALIIPLVHSYACTPPSIPHRETQITAASVINPSAICLGNF